MLQNDLRNRPGCVSKNIVLCPAKRESKIVSGFDFAEILFFTLTKQKKSNKELNLSTSKKKELVKLHDKLGKKKETPEFVCRCSSQGTKKMLKILLFFLASAFRNKLTQKRRKNGQLTWKSSFFNLSILISASKEQILMMKRKKPYFFPFVFLFHRF